MKYSFKTLPSSARNLKFRVKSEDKKHETHFNISREVFSTWGRPLESELREFMIAYIKKNGWAKEPVEICEKSPRSLYKYTLSLREPAGKKKSSK